MWVALLRAKLGEILVTHFAFFCWRDLLILKAIKFSWIDETSVNVIIELYSNRD